MSLAFKTFGLCSFFFQAEDGIRAPLVTGVQTCALPICDDLYEQCSDHITEYIASSRCVGSRPRSSQIGRASWRGRVWKSGGAGVRTKKRHQKAGMGARSTLRAPSAAGVWRTERRAPQGA